MNAFNIFMQFGFSPISTDCQTDLTAVGVTAEQIAEHGYSADFRNGMTSLDTYANAIYGNVPQAANIVAKERGGETMAQYMSLNPGTEATSQILGNIIYVNPALVNGMDNNGMGNSDVSAMLVHEFIHNITGKTDDTIQRALNIDVTPITSNISDKFKKDCGL